MPACLARGHEGLEPHAPRRRKGRNFCWPLVLLLSATCSCPTNFGLAAQRTKARAGSLQGADAAQDAEKDSRVVAVTAERSQQVDLPGATVGSMDSLMRDEAVQVLAAGAERTEKSPEGTDIWLAFMKPTHMGPWKNQVRLKCQLLLESSGSVRVDIIGFDVGRPDKDTGEMVFESYAKETFSLSWENSISWRLRGGVLRLVHLSFGKVRMALPWWFPLPDALVKATVEAGIGLMLRDGQSKVVAAISARHSARQAQPSA
mmetsp:Transcript_42525/g.98576  ORF Transcript_42525/g.98576 Transcript_42525/m.98576 type:complete len:260 (+) Transcript_42525:69-848(+)